MRRRNFRTFAAAALLSASPTLAVGFTAAKIAVRTAGSAERWEVDLGGRLVAALAPRAPDSGDLLLLVTPDGEPDAPRRLLRIGGGPSPSVAIVAGSVEGWVKALAAFDPGHGPELLAGGIGRLASFGPLESPSLASRDLIVHPGFDLRSLAPSRLRVGVLRDVAAAEVGVLRVWASDGHDKLALEAELHLPFAAKSDASGLELDGVPVVELPPDGDGRRRFAAGPEPVGTRLRVVVATHEADGWKSAEAWASLPGPEEVEESWLGTIDGAPGLVVHTQGAVAVDAFERQRWRAFRLAADVTRSGHGPGLAVTVDSKRWQDADAELVDVDGDGHDDVVVARAEGMTGGDLVVEVYRGLGGGAFAPDPRRTDVGDPPRRFELLRDADGRGRPGIVGLYRDRVVLWRLASAGGRALEHAPLVDAPLPELPPRPKPPVEGAFHRTRREWLGIVPRRGSPPALLVVETSEIGNERLIVVRSGSR